MGGLWSLRQWTGQPDMTGVVQETFDRIEAQMSLWRPDSALSRLNRAPPDTWVELPAETLTVLAAGLDLMRTAPGAFSVLLGACSARAGFQPGAACVHSADPSVIEIEGSRVRRRDDVGVDLNALAKGFAADCAAARLHAAGVHDFLIEVAGDLRADGRRPDGLPWTAVLELPIPDRIVAGPLIPLLDGALATSGGYRRRRGTHAHIFDPRTGRPLAADAGSVAVAATAALAAEGWATVLSVLGPEAGLAFAADRNLPAVFLTPEEDGFREAGSPAMAARLGLAPHP